MDRYDEEYSLRIKERQGELFFYAREVYPDMDDKWFIKKWMTSELRYFIDYGNPKYLNMPATELMDRFVNDELKGEYKKGDDWGGTINLWTGQFYQLYHWKYDIWSKDLIKLVTLEDIERIFPALHQMGWDAALTKVKEVTL